MKPEPKSQSANATASSVNADAGRTPAHRIGMVIGIRPDRVSAYEALHAASNPGVRDLLSKYNMHNFSIFIH